MNLQCQALQGGERLESRIIEMNLDSQFCLDRKYAIVSLLGILYHLKSPFYALTDLLNSMECNNDETNYVGRAEKAVPFTVTNNARSFCLLDIRHFRDNAPGQ